MSAMVDQDLKKIKIGFIGGGNMASAIGAGLIRKNVLTPENVWISSRTDRTHRFWRDLGAKPTFNNSQVVDNCDVVFLSVKPQMLEDAFETIKSTTGEKFESKLFISVLAGVPLEVLYAKIGWIVNSPRIVRTMPNMPMMVGEGIIGTSKERNIEDKLVNENATSMDLQLIDKLFSYIGMSQNVPESLMNAVGSLSGCGPAFAYSIIEALADGAVRMGVPRPMATKFAAQVLIGAGKMVLETGRHPGQLKDEVCSPGGTTITGIHAIEIGGVRGSMMNAIEAAVKRSNELTALSQNNFENNFEKKLDPK